MLLFKFELGVDELSQKEGYLEQYYSSEWNFLDNGGAVIVSKKEQKGVCNAVLKEGPGTDNPS